MASSDALWVHDRCDMDMSYICSKKLTLEPIPEPDEGCEPVGVVDAENRCQYNRLGVAPMDLSP